MANIINENNKEIKSFNRNLRITPRKARLIIDLIRGKNVDKALSILYNTNKLGTYEILKIINNTINNAVNNFHMITNKLYISTIFANDGIKMKRRMPRAKGNAFSIIKRTSNITVILKERE